MMMIKSLLLSLMVISISADKALMIKECHNALPPARAPCMQCLESDPKSVKADVVGIAGIVINCLDSSLHTITNNVTSLLKEEKVSAVKKALEYWMESSPGAITQLSEAKKALAAHDYDKADHSLAIAIAPLINCTIHLQQAKFKSPQLYMQIDKYYKLSEAAMRIIDRL